MRTFLSSPLSLMTCCCCFSLDALDPDAYEAFQASNNLSDVVQRCLQKKHIKAGVLPGMSKKLSIRASLMTPVKPMLVCIDQCGVNQELQCKSKDLGTLWKNPSKLYFCLWLWSKWQILIGSGFIPLSHLLTQQCCIQNWTYFYPFCSQFNALWEERGRSLVLVILKTLLISIAGF